MKVCPLGTQKSELPHFVQKPRRAAGEESYHCNVLADNSLNDDVGVAVYAAKPPWERRHCVQ
jgi:hypothetical protein